MRYFEFKELQEQNVPQKAGVVTPGVSPAQVTKQDIIAVLKQGGYEDLKIAGNKIGVLVQIPSGKKKAEFRSAMLDEILTLLQQKLPEGDAEYSNDPGISSIGGIVFTNSPAQIVVKDSGKQGDSSAGVANELELASLLQSVIEKYKSANITFVDPRGKKLAIRNCTGVEVAGRDSKDRKKADVVLTSKSGRLPISIKKLDADMWESADNLFGQRARAVLDKLVADGVIELNEIGNRKLKVGKEVKSVPVYELSKEVVMEPTQEEALSAIFGSDLNPSGGVVVQTFKPEHFKQVDNNITVSAHAVITNASEIPESHMMVWLLRNDSTRNGGTLGLAGIRPLGVTLIRGIGKSGKKDVVLVDQYGNVVKNPNI